MGRIWGSSKIIFLLIGHEKHCKILLKLNLLSVRNMVGFQPAEEKNMDSTKSIFIAHAMNINTYVAIKTKICLFGVVAFCARM